MSEKMSVFDSLIGEIVVITCRNREEDYYTGEMIEFNPHLGVGIKYSSHGNEFYTMAHH